MDNALNNIQVIQILPLYTVLPSLITLSSQSACLVLLPTLYAALLFLNHLTLMYAQMQVSCTSEIDTMWWPELNHHDDCNIG